MEEKKLSAAKLSISANLFFIILKIAVGLFTGSIGILAECIHSSLDLVASLLAYFGIKKGSEAADECHPYGHEKYENLSAVAQMMLITITAVIILYEAIDKFNNPSVNFEEYGILLMLFTILGAWFVARYLYKISSQEHSHALESDAHHFTTDVWASIAVMAGLVLSKLGFKWGDPLAAILVAFIMLKLSFETGKQMLEILLEHTVEPAILEKIKSTISSNPDVVRYHKLRARYIGSKVWIDVHIHLSRRKKLAEAHKIAHGIKDAIMRNVENVKEVNIHLEPD